MFGQVGGGNHAGNAVIMGNRQMMNVVPGHMKLCLKSKGIVFQGGWIKSHDLGDRQIDVQRLGDDPVAQIAVGNYACKLPLAQTRMEETRSLDILRAVS